MKSIASTEEFGEYCAQVEDRFHGISSLLLYTELDEDLNAYLRAHWLTLDTMSETSLLVFVPAQTFTSDGAVADLSIKLGQKIGVEMNRFPCVVLLSDFERNIERTRKAYVYSLRGKRREDYSAAFTGLFYACKSAKATYADSWANNTRDTRATVRQHIMNEVRPELNRQKALEYIGELDLPASLVPILIEIAKKAVGA